MQLPIFPLNTVLFPGCRIPLRVFEPRYLDMIADCLKREHDFIVVLISEGYEVGLAPKIFSIGTVAKIIDWNQLENGMLSIVVEGMQRVEILSTEVQSDQLLLGDVRPLHVLTASSLLAKDELLDLLEQLERHPMIERFGVNLNHQDPLAVLWCLSGLLPFSNAKKQYLLELSDAKMLENAFARLLEDLEGEG